jgi:hypothetical protein
VPYSVWSSIARSLSSQYNPILLGAPWETGRIVVRELVLCRKGHYGRALEESIQTQKSQWPRAWSGTNPLSGGRGFQTMTALERVSSEGVCFCR